MPRESTHLFTFELAARSGCDMGSHRYVISLRMLPVSGRIALIAYPLSQELSISFGSQNFTRVRYGSLRVIHQLLYSVNWRSHADTRRVSALDVS